MGAMRVGEIAGHINLGRLQTLQKRDDVRDILGMNRCLGDGAGAVKPQVHEFQLFRRDAARQGRGACLGLPDERLDLE